MNTFKKNSTSNKSRLAFLPDIKRKNPVYTPQTIDWGVRLMSIPEVWPKTKGKGIKVAVLDTGVQSDHPDLIGNIAEVHDFSDSDNGGEDTDGHGTHVAGIIAAMDNQKGIIGVAPEASLYIAKVVNKDVCRIEYLIKAIDWAIYHQVDIINISLRMEEYDEELHEKIREADKAGIFIVCASGDIGVLPDQIEYPGKFHETLAVGSFNYIGEKSRFTAYGTQLDILAPGEDIFSTYLNDSYIQMSGTSMSAPFVSGLIALMLSDQNSKSASKDRLKTNVHDLRKSLKELCVHSHKMNEKYDHQYCILDPVKLINS